MACTINSHIFSICIHLFNLSNRFTQIISFLHTIAYYYWTIDSHVFSICTLLFYLNNRFTQILLFLYILHDLDKRFKEFLKVFWLLTLQEGKVSVLHHPPLCFSDKSLVLLSCGWFNIRVRKKNAALFGDWTKDYVIGICNAFSTSLPYGLLNYN